MRTYVAVSGTLFGLVVAAHVARVAQEGRSLLGDPGWMALTALALGMAGWAAALLRRRPRS